MASNVRGASPAERSERWVGAAALIGNGEQRTRGFARRTQRAMGRRGCARRKWRATHAGRRPQNATSGGQARQRWSETTNNGGAGRGGAVFRTNEPTPQAARGGG